MERKPSFANIAKSPLLRNGVLAAGIAFWGCGEKHDLPVAVSPAVTFVPQSEENYFKPEEMELKKNIEKEFGVEIINYGQFLERFYGIGTPPRFTDRWDIDRLSLLEDLLSALPAHFLHADHRSIEENHRISIALSELVSQCFPDFPTSEDRECHTIKLDSRKLKQELRAEAFLTLVHELVHSITNEEVVSNENHLSSPLFDKVDAILGTPLGDIEEEFERIAQDKMDQLLSGIDRETLLRKIKLTDNLPEEGNRAVFYADFTYGLGNYGEFISVLSEYYIQGKEVFFARYGEFFSEDVIQGLYDFMREHIFRGIEYERLPVERGGPFLE